MRDIERNSRAIAFTITILFSYWMAVQVIPTVMGDMEESEQWKR